MEEDPEHCEPNKSYDQKCPYCERTFIYTIEYYPSYYSKKAPCLNGEPHDWQDILEDEYYRRFFSVWRRCKCCEKEEREARKLEAK